MRFRLEEEKIERQEWEKGKERKHRKEEMTYIGKRFFYFWVEREVPIKWVLRSKTKKKQNRGEVESKEHLEV